MRKFTVFAIAVLETFISDNNNKHILYSQGTLLFISHLLSLHLVMHSGLPSRLKFSCWFQTPQGALIASYAVIVLHVLCNSIVFFLPACFSNVISLS